MKNEEGTIELGAVVILFFLSSLLAGSVLFLSSNMTYFTRNSRDVAEKNQADLLLGEIIKKMQPLKEHEYDDNNNFILKSLCSDYFSYNLKFEDISSGYHLDFLTDEDLADPLLCKYLFNADSSSSFVEWRDNNGLSKDKTHWRSFIKENAWASCVSYGWVNLNQINSFAFRAITQSFKTNNPEKLFPLVNNLPLINVNMVNPESLTPLIFRPSFNIEEPEEKAEAFLNKLAQGSVLVSDISSYLEIPKDNLLFTYLGTKTTFWKINYIYREGLLIEAIVAAIPYEANLAHTGIKEYRLIDRVFIYGL
ncbi:MAG: hypothetical protein FWH35_00905 [Treponema sp.]|nr:hypothetical protein [Treponema sp.]